MKKSEAVFGLLRLPMDSLGVLAALLVSYRLREISVDLIPGIQLLDPSPTLPLFSEYFSTFVWPGVLLFLIVAAVLRLYALRTTGSAWSEMGRIVLAALVWAVVVMVWYFLIVKQLFYSRILLVHSTFFIILFVALARTAAVLLQRAMLRLGIGVRLVVSMGEQPIALNARETLARDIRYEYLGHVTDLSSLQTLKQRCTPDLIIQTDPNPQGAQTIKLIDYCRSNHIGYAFLPPVFADVPHLLRVERLGLLPMLQFQPTPLDGWGRIFKRIFDLVGSVLLIVILSPLLLLITIMVFVIDGWPMWYVSRRIGQFGQISLPVLKFRSMVRNADAQKDALRTDNQRSDGPLFKMKNDPRVTRLGRVLRRFDLDELPQLFNVLVGQMSLVGPRAHLPDEVDRYTQYQRRVFAIKPGMTGLAQVSGRSDLKFKEEVRLDLQYIEEWSIFIDLWILWRTAMVVLTRGGTD